MKVKGDLARMRVRGSNQPEARVSACTVGEEQSSPTLDRRYKLDDVAMLRTLSITLPDALGVSEGLLILDGEVLLAVLGRLSDKMFGPSRGKWHVEATFAPELICSGDVFEDVQAILIRLSEAA